MKLTRRTFIGSMFAGGVALAADKIFDGGLADVSLPGIPRREEPLLPPGAESNMNFRKRCVGCQLCVAACPNKVLRPARGRDFPRPEMGFDKGWCRPECTKCSQVCPAGAIREIGPAEKPDIHIGCAEWHKEACLAQQKGVHCTVCERHCPEKAIVLVPLDPGNPGGVCVPVVDSARCTGCGACENLCPARPMPGMQVQAFEHHRHVRPMDEAEVVGEAIHLIEVHNVGCVLINDGVITATAKGNGVAPILALLDTHAKEFAGAVVVDKIVGRAAAAVAIKGGAVKVCALVASTGAKELLGKYGIALEAKELADNILNRAKTGGCPFDAAISEMDNPSAMVEALRTLVPGR